MAGDAYQSNSASLSWSLIKTSSNVKTRRIFFLKFNFRLSDKAVRELHSKWKKDGTARDMHAANSGRPVTARTSQLNNNFRPLVLRR